MDSHNQQITRLNQFQRTFIIIWFLMTIFGALNATVLPWLRAGSRFNLNWIPHLRYGHVMFNQNSPEVITIWFRSKSTQGVWRHISELVPTPAPAYKQARVTPFNETTEFAIRYFDVTKPKPLVTEKRIRCSEKILYAE